jgi:L-seryl-tRNA(Ser) seleniumtransferase
MSELARLPKIDRVASHPALDGARRRLGAEAVTNLVRAAVDDARARVKAGAPCPSVDDVALAVARAAEARLARRVRSVVNATGVVLHTNLGRAPLGLAATSALAASASRYASLELDLATGKRGGRAPFAEGALAELTGAEAALVVNNNAAAVLLALSALTAGRPVVVSRGEAVEIGGGFRIPEVLARSGARMVEVGTTNKTRLDDVARALDEHPDAAAVLRVHPGNFRMTGFVERPELAALAALCRARGVLLIKDLGGGALLDFASLEARLAGEPMVRASIEAGADVVCFSTDKLLGGPQGGAIVGGAAHVARCRRDPLARALRAGRLPLVALEATLEAYLAGDLDAVPTLAALRRPLADVRARAAAWQAALASEAVACEVVALDGAVGGGSLAEERVPSAGVALEGDAEALASRLRAGDPPVLGRVVEDRLTLDARTVLPDEDAALVAAVVAAAAPRL